MMLLFLTVIQALILGAIFVHSACVLSKTRFKGWLNPIWLSHICFLGFAMYSGSVLLKSGNEFNGQLMALEGAVLLHLIADYIAYKKGSRCTVAKIFG